MDPIQFEVVVVGAGPGGYAAAFYAADKGRKVLLIEQEKRLGGVCLNAGCIPSKALLHATQVMTEARESGLRGIHFENPRIDLAQMRAWKDSILNKLGGGIAQLAKARGVEIWNGRARFADAATLRVETEAGPRLAAFQRAILATGSRSAMPRAFDLGNPRVMTSLEALQLETIPENLLVIGGGYIGMELGTVFSALGSKVTVVEALPSILAGADADLVRPVLANAQKRFKEVRLNTKVASMTARGERIEAILVGPDGAEATELFDRVLVSVGRVPNTQDLGLECTQIALDEKGFIKINSSQETTQPGVYAIGDVTGGVLLAHKAHKEARVAVGAICGEASEFTDIVLPAVVFTDPEVAWCGLTEAEARQKGIRVEIARFPWAASGRALSFDRADGVTKLIVEPETERVVGVGIVGAGAGELIAEGVLAVEMGATACDLAECVHPHPTLSETMMEAAESFYGYATHTYSRRKRGQEPAR